MPPDWCGGFALAELGSFGSARRAGVRSSAGVSPAAATHSACCVNGSLLEKCSNESSWPSSTTGAGRSPGRTRDRPGGAAVAGRPGSRRATAGGRRAAGPPAAAAGGPRQAAPAVGGDRGRLRALQHLQRLRALDTRGRGRAGRTRPIAIFFCLAALALSWVDCASAISRALLRRQRLRRFGRRLAPSVAGGAAVGSTGGGTWRSSASGAVDVCVERSVSPRVSGSPFGDSAKSSFSTENRRPVACSSPRRTPTSVRRRKRKSESS